MKQTLLPYQATLRSLQNSDFTGQQICNHIKSKLFYAMLKNTNLCLENCLTRIVVPYCSNRHAVGVFTKKVVSEKEIKLKEFNFKILHGILSCNATLKR